jgi:hypothetical protein
MRLLSGIVAAHEFRTVMGGDASLSRRPMKRVIRPLTEWYQNDPEGIEQGFSLDSRPAGTGQLLIEGTLSGTLQPLIADAGRALEFRTPEGCRVLRYDGLTVVDARGRELPSSLDLADAAITIRIDDTDAVYPVLVDPILTTLLDREWRASQRASARSCRRRAT